MRPAVPDPAPSPDPAPCVLVTHEYAPFRGGVATYVREMAGSAQRAGFLVEVWTVDYRGRVGYGAPTAAVDDSDTPFPVVRLASDGRLTPGGLGKFAWGIFRRRRLLRDRRVILLSVGAQMVFFVFGALGIVSAARVTCFFHGSEILRFRRHRCWRWLACRFYARAGRFAVNSFHVEHLLRASGLLPEGARIGIAPCAVPSVFVREAPQTAPDEADDGRWRILTVARLHPRKGQLEVARALALLPEAQRKRIVYQMIGGGEIDYLGLVTDTCRAGGVEWECIAGLSDEQLGTMYRRTTIYAQASRTLPQSVEGFGISLLEASFHGCPIAAFRSGGVAEAVRDGETGLLVPEGDIPALAAAVGRLLADPALRARLGETGRRFAREFHWEEAARALL